ncbi:MAG: virulence RhuM family protein [Bacteroidales bacterium]|nr:virulence RhuM family protein [Bacteroidales bacterium]
MSDPAVAPVGGGEIILYQPDEVIRLEVRLENNSVWLNRLQLAELFGRDVKTIGKHINIALKEELKDLPTVAFFATVQQEGERLVTRQIEYYNLDMIISIGYRVHSAMGVHFRRWANSVLKDYLLKGYSVNRRIAAVEDRFDRRLNEHERLLEEHSRRIDFFVKTSLPPVEGVFFDGQVFDAFAFVSGLVKSAVHRIVLIDNYVDESVLTLLDKRPSDVSATIYTDRISARLSLDIDKHNMQYPPVDIKVFRGAHDRFLIIDDTVYHIGASLKDLGKKWFAFSVLHFPADDLIARLA